MKVAPLRGASVVAQDAAVNLARENDVERLRQAALLLEAENLRLTSKVMEPEVGSIKRVSAGMSVT